MAAPTMQPVASDYELDGYRYHIYLRNGGYVAEPAFKPTHSKVSRKAGAPTACRRAAESWVAEQIGAKQASAPLEERAGRRFIELVSAAQGAVDEEQRLQAAGSARHMGHADHECWQLGRFLQQLARGLVDYE